MSVSAQLRHLRYWYAGTKDPALDGIDLSIDGGLTLLTGASGSGKSTLLRVFNGLVPHFHGGTMQGSAVVFGHDVLRTTTRQLAQDVGFLFQDPELQSVYGTVERDVAFGLENLGVPRLEMLTRVDEALARSGMSALRHRRVVTLSGGERQRLALAGVLALRPRLLALDEPLSQLDAEGARSLLRTLDELARKGTSIVVAEHRVAGLAGRTEHHIRLLRGAIDSDGRWSGVGDGSRQTVSEPSRTVLGAWGEARVSGGAAAPLRPRGLAGSVSHSALVWRLDGVSAGPARDVVLSDVDVAGCAGEVVVLMGPNGGGKTTLLRTIAGLLTPMRGAVDRAQGRVAYLPQNPTALLHRPSVRAEVELTLRRSEDRESPDEIIAQLGLNDVAHRYPRDLSTGQRQRTALAAVLAGTPALALLDEPTRGMDDAARESLRDVINRLTARGTAIVLATHDDELARLVGDRFVLVAGGAARELETMAATPA